MRAPLLLPLGSLIVVLVLIEALSTPATADSGKRPTPEERQAALQRDVTQGALRVELPKGEVVECPLKHTDVKADISGFIARVTVTQTFHNPLKEKIEAVYVFPLPHESAVDDMTMVIGDRKIVGLIKRRDEARDIYQQALRSGQTAALLEQERPNIFTQSVGNIEPGQDVNIKISYVDVLRYDVGAYEFHFPMVVGPRFNPGSPTGAPSATPPELQGKVSPPVFNTDRVPDAARISPPVLKPGMRNGHDVSLAVSLDAGVPVQAMKVANHRAETKLDGKTRATIVLAKDDAIPNKDFVLRYEVVGKKPEMAVLAHTGSYTDTRRLGHGYFMLMVQPKEDERLKKSPPREIVFLVDVSGSMSGPPTQKCIEAMNNMLKLCREKDTVQVITFANDANSLFEKPVPVNEGNIRRALDFTKGLRGGGGTQMLLGVQKAIDQPIDKERLRIVVMLTDGYIGNEKEIIEHVGKHCGDQVRFWAIGIGSSPNMFLIDGVAKQGGGMGKKLGLSDDSAALTQEVMTRIQRAQLSKVKIDWGGLEVAETYPARIPELWAGRPIILLGRYHGGGTRKITISGNVEGEAVSWPLEVSLPKEEKANDVLAKAWARRKIEDLMHQTYYGGSPAVEEMVTAMALDYRLMSQYTSFVAVDEWKKPEPTARPPRQMLVPVPLPQGTQWEGFFGGEGEMREADGLFALKRLGKLSADKSSIRIEQYEMALKMAPSAAPIPRPLARQQAQRMTSMTVAKPTLGTGLGGRGVIGMRGDRGGGYERLRRQQSASVATVPTLQANQIPGNGPGAQLQGLSLALVDDSESMDLGDWQYGNRWHGFHQVIDAHRQWADKSLSNGKKLRDEKKSEAAEKEFAAAYFWGSGLDPYNDGGISQAALAHLTELRAEKVAAWAAALPALQKRLDLVIRDKSLGEAIGAVAGASGLDITVLPGSTDDAARLLDGQDVRVDYLDLRHAKVAEALEWLTQPARLTWSADGEGKGAKITVGSARRMAGDNGWIYDVAVLVAPVIPETKTQEDYQKSQAATKKAAEEFLNTARKALGADEKQVAWFGPGQLVVLGNADLHARTAKLLADLADPKANVHFALASLHKETSKRAAGRNAKVVKLQQARAVRDVAEKHIQFGWALLAAAADGQVDMEALAQVQIAWKRPENAKLLEKAAGLPLRSYWQVREAARLLPDNQELQKLAAIAAEQSKPAAEAALAAVKKNPEDGGALAALIYAALAGRGEAFSQQALAAMKNDNKASQYQPVRLVARVLLGKAAPEDAKALQQLVGSGNVGQDDMVVLTALACRAAGGETWDQFRGEMRDILGRQVLSGDVVVLLNRLSGKGVAIAQQ